MVFSYENYVEELRTAVEERTGEECPTWMLPMIRAAAQNMTLVDKCIELFECDSLMVEEMTSTGAIKTQPTPMLMVYKEAQRCLTLQLEKIGITYSATPSKMTTSSRRGIDKKDPMQLWASTANEE